MGRGSAFVDSLIGSKVAGRYVVDKMLGTGGMGVVAGAKYPELGKRVAIKFLRPEHADDEVVKQRFLREGRVASRVKSSHFVQVLDVGTLESGIPFLVMEMLTGRDLADELRARGPLPVADAIDIVLQACTGIAELHALGVVHRDLKPSNLFVSEGAGTKTIKVLDFGISKERASETNAKNPLTATDNVLGTPQYMSPEQIKHSKDVDARSDVWALGVILYELLTEKLPFVAEGPGIGELFARILYFDPEPPSKHRDDLPPELEAVIMKCITRELADRIHDVGALAEALRPFAAAKSLHRIDAVHEALATPTPQVDGSVPPPAPEKEISLAATVQVGQSKRPPDPSVSVSAAPVEAESIHASSVELAGIPKKRKGSTLTFAAIGGLAVIVGAIAFAMTRAKDDVPPPPSPGTSAGIVATPAPSPSPSPAPTPSVTAWERETATVPSASAAPAVCAAPVPASAVPVTARPQHQAAPKTGGGAPAPKPSSAPKASPAADPILDRK